MSSAASYWDIVHTGPHAFHIRLVAPNAEPIVWSENYRTRRAAREAIDLAVLYGTAALRNGRVRELDERP